jgi:hypothetical protein
VGVGVARSRAGVLGDGAVTEIPVVAGDRAGARGGGPTRVKRDGLARMNARSCGRKGETGAWCGIMTTDWYSGFFPPVERPAPCACRVPSACTANV